MQFPASPLQGKLDWKEQIRDLSSSSKNFGSKQIYVKTYKGGALAPPSLVFFVGFLRPKSVQTGAWGEAENYNLDLRYNCMFIIGI